MIIWQSDALLGEHWYDSETQVKFHPCQPNNTCPAQSSCTFRSYTSFRRPTHQNRSERWDTLHLAWKVLHRIHIRHERSVHPLLNETVAPQCRLIVENSIAANRPNVALCKQGWHVIGTIVQGAIAEELQVSNIGSLIRRLIPVPGYTTSPGIDPSD